MKNYADNICEILAIVLMGFAVLAALNKDYTKGIYFLFYSYYLRQVVRDNS